MSVVAYVSGVKIQFATSVVGRAPIANGVGVRVSMPSEVLRLQRRAQARVKPSRPQPLECMVRGELNLPSLLRMTVLDIGSGGVALLARARDTYRVGQQLLNCSFDLADEGEFTTDLNVRHVERLEGLGGWCYGCAYAGISPKALEQVSAYIARIEARRRETLSKVA